MSREGVSLVTVDPVTKTMYYVKKTNGIKSIFREKDGMDLICQVHSIAFVHFLHDRLYSSQ